MDVSREKMRGVPSSEKLAVDKKEIIEFFRALLIDGEEIVDVRYIDKRPGNKSTGKNDCGPPLKLLPRLIKMTEGGLCTSLLINVTDRQGCCDKNIVGFRAFYVDIDGYSLPSFKLKPTVLYRRTDGRYHAYWILPLDKRESVTKEKHRRIQSLLIHHYQGDLQAKNPSFVLRIPGTLHWKSGECLRGYSLHEESGAYYSYEQVYEAHANLPEKVLRSIEKDVEGSTKFVEGTGLGSTPLPEDKIAEAKKNYTVWLSNRDSAVEGEFGDRHTYSTACYGVKDLGLSEHDAYECLIESGWNARCKPPWGEGELKGVIRNANKYGKNNRTVERPTTNIHFPEETDNSWRSSLEVSKKGAILKTQNNIFLAVSHGLKLKGKIQYDLMKQRYMINEEMPWAKKGYIDFDLDVPLVRELLRDIGICCEITRPIKDALHGIGIRDKVDPLADYIGSLEWDGVKRIDTWLSDYGGAANILYHREAGAKTLISGIARALSPDAKVDTMLILEGDEGGAKSSVCKCLGKSWSSEATDPISSGKGFIEIMIGKWVVEFPELMPFENTRAEAIKAFLSKSSDFARLAYGACAKDWYRRCIFIGTSNKTDYLTKSRGYRRYWPIALPGEQFLPRIEAFSEIVDQLWAEAKVRFLAGESWVLSKEADAYQRSLFNDRVPPDAMGELINAYFIDAGDAVKEAYSYEDIFTGVLCVPDYKKTTSGEKREVREIMISVGWHPRVKKMGDYSKTVFIKEKKEKR